MPATILTQKVAEKKIARVAPCLPPPLIYPQPELIVRAAVLLASAKKPLVIVGKGTS